MAKKTLQALRREAIRLGAAECVIIDAVTVKAAPWVRYKCQFGCSGFGERLTCPPYSPVPEQTRALLKEYKKALLIHCAAGTKHDISAIAVRIEKEAFWSGYYKALAMGAGPCRLCRSCNTKSLCRHPDDARPSMEACGIDVFQTARRNGFVINTLVAYACKADYFSLVLIE